MRAKVLCLWASLLVGAFLWFSLGVGVRSNVMDWVNEKPDIIGVWEFGPDEVVVTENYIEWKDTKAEYKVRYEGDLIVVTSPIPKNTDGSLSAVTLFSQDVMFLLKKNGDDMQLIGMGLETNFLFKRKS